MKTIKLGRTDWPVSRLGYGCWRLVDADGPEALTAEQIAGARRAVSAAYEAGYTLFDLADIYSRGAAEAAFGAVLREIPGMRDRVRIVTKCGIRFVGEPEPTAPYRYDFSEAHILRSVEGSLRRLGVETIDVLLLHRPDYLFHPEEVARAFAKLKDSGKVRAFGVSNFRPSQVALLQSACPMPLVAHQIEFSLLQLDPLDNGLLDQCLQTGMTPQAWSPLGGGALLRGGDLHEDHETDVRVHRIQETLRAIARERETTPTVVALAWLRRHPSGVQPIVGSRRPERIREAAAAADLELTREEWYRLLEASRGSRLP
ncbi:MAG: aldo/keto reductase [Verrucomicrobia bacterium]|nr:MAG: aldo/keto reductase [Verrucomicrobiota bacterium]